MPDTKSKAAFTFFVNNQEFQATQHELTGSRIKELAGVPTNYELFQVRGIETVPVGSEEIVHMHEHFHFRAIPAGTFGKDGPTT